MKTMEKANVKKKNEMERRRSRKIIPSVACAIPNQNRIHKSISVFTPTVYLYRMHKCRTFLAFTFLFIYFSIASHSMEKETQKPEHVCNTFDCTETSLSLFTFSEGVSHFYDIEIFVSLQITFYSWYHLVLFTFYIVSQDKKNEKKIKVVWRLYAHHENKCIAPAYLNDISERAKDVRQTRICISVSSSFTFGFFFYFNLPVSYTVNKANSISLVNWKAKAMVHYVMSTFGAFNKMSPETIAVFIICLEQTV